MRETFQSMLDIITNLLGPILTFYLNEMGSLLYNPPFMSIVCHYCRTSKSDWPFIARCCKKRCNKAYCLKCIRKYFNNQFDTSMYRKDTWICFFCQEKCTCYKCSKKIRPWSVREDKGKKTEGKRQEQSEEEEDEASECIYNPKKYRRAVPARKRRDSRSSSSSPSSSSESESGSSYSSSEEESSSSGLSESESASKQSKSKPVGPSFRIVPESQLSKMHPLERHQVENRNFFYRFIMREFKQGRLRATPQK